LLYCWDCDDASSIIFPYAISLSFCYCSETFWLQFSKDSLEMAWFITIEYIASWKSTRTKPHAWVYVLQDNASPHHVERHDVDKIHEWSGNWYLFFRMIWYLNLGWFIRSPFIWWDLLLLERAWTWWHEFNTLISVQQAGLEFCGVIRYRVNYVAWQKYIKLV